MFTTVTLNFFNKLETQNRRLNSPTFEMKAAAAQDAAEEALIAFERHPVAELRDMESNARCVHIFPSRLSFLLQYNHPHSAEHCLSPWMHYVNQLQNVSCLQSLPSQFFPILFFVPLFSPCRSQSIAKQQELRVALGYVPPFKSI